MAKTKTKKESSTTAKFKELTGVKPEKITDEQLKKVQDLGIYRFDTSPRYGNSESLLGEYIEQSNKKLFISTKIDNLKSNDPKSPKTIVEKVKTSLKKLNRKNIDVCYLHQNEMEIISDPYIHEGLG